MKRAYMNVIRRCAGALSLLFLVLSVHSMDLDFLKKKCPEEIEMKTFRDYTNMRDGHNIVHSFLYEPIVYQSIWQKLPKDMKRVIATDILQRAPLMTWVTEKCVVSSTKASFAISEMKSDGEMTAWRYPKILEGYFSPVGDKVAITLGGTYNSKPFLQNGIKLFNLSTQKLTDLGPQWEVPEGGELSGPYLLIEKENKYYLAKALSMSVPSKPVFFDANSSMKICQKEVCTWQHDEKNGLEIYLLNRWYSQEKYLAICDSVRPDKPLNMFSLECTEFLRIDPTGTKVLVECSRGNLRIYDLSNLHRILRYFKKEILLEHVILLNCIRWMTSRLAKKFDFRNFPHLKSYYNSLPAEVKEATAGVVIGH